MTLPLDSLQEPAMLSTIARHRAPLARAGLVLAAALSAPFPPTPAAAQSQASQAATRSSGTAAVYYVVLWRTELLSLPDTTAPVVAMLDSGQVVRPDGAELFQTGHARVIVNGKRGWVDNGYIKRVVMMRTTDTLRMTVKRSPPRRPLGDPREPDRVLPKKP